MEKDPGKMMATIRRAELSFKRFSAASIACGGAAIAGMGIYGISMEDLGSTVLFLGFITSLSSGFAASGRRQLADRTRAKRRVALEQEASGRAAITQ